MYSKAPHSSSIGMRQVGSQARLGVGRFNLKSNKSDEMSINTQCYTLLLYNTVYNTIIYYILCKEIERDTKRYKEMQTAQRADVHEMVLVVRKLLSDQNWTNSAKHRRFQMLVSLVT